MKTTEVLQDELRRIEARVSATRAMIKQGLAQTQSDFLAAVEEELGIWKGRMEELGLQTHLGAMEMQDRAAPALVRASLAIDQIRRAINELSDDSFDQHLTDSIQASLASLRTEIETAEELGN